MNEHTIKLVEGKQLSYGLIYSLRLVKLEILKIHIKTHLKTRFIQLSKFPIGILIFFNQKLDRSLYFCINYQSINYLNIKNWHLLPLIAKALYWPGQAKQFTSLDLINTHHKMRIQESNKWKTVFNTKYGYFEYQVMFLDFLILRLVFKAV